MNADSETDEKLNFVLLSTLGAVGFKLDILKTVLTTVQFHSAEAKTRQY